MCPEILTVGTGVGLGVGVGEGVGVGDGVGVGVGVGVGLGVGDGVGVGVGVATGGGKQAELAAAAVKNGTKVIVPVPGVEMMSPVPNGLVGWVGPLAEFQ